MVDTSPGTYTKFRNDPLGSSSHRLQLIGVEGARSRELFAARLEPSAGTLIAWKVSTLASVVDRANRELVI